MKYITHITTIFLLLSIACSGIVGADQYDNTYQIHGDMIISPASLDTEDVEGGPVLNDMVVMSPIDTMWDILSHTYAEAYGFPPYMVTQLFAILTSLLAAGALSLLITRKKLPEDPESRPVIVYNAIKEHPGMNMAQLQKITGIPRSSINYTLYRLSLAGKVKKTTDKGAGTYYPTNIPATGHEEFMNKVLTHDKPHKIFQTIIDIPGISQKRLVEETGIPQTTLQWHLSQLAKYHAIDSVRDKNTVHYTAIPDYLLMYNQLAEANMPETNTENAEDADQAPKEKTTKNTKHANES